MIATIRAGRSESVGSTGVLLTHWHTVRELRGLRALAALPADVDAEAIFAPETTSEGRGAYGSTIVRRARIRGVHS
jgi:hypothetical protein